MLTKYRKRAKTIYNSLFGDAIYRLIVKKRWLLHGYYKARRS